MFVNRTVRRLEHMLDAAVNGTFQESDYDETRLSRLETKWKQFLETAVVSKENLRRERGKVRELITDISHQTKTPMTNIKLYAALLGEQLSAQEHAAPESLLLLEELQRQTDKLEFLIQSLTKLSRLESNVMEVVPTKQKLSLLLAEALAQALPKARGREIVLENSYAGEDTARYDLKWTTEALFNVLDNALKYSPPHSTVRISVSVYEMYAAVSVRDHGIGISEQEQAKIFARFYRAPDVQQEDGVGVGLYLAREILSKENGYIRVKSRPGDGAEFLLYLWRG